MNSSTVISEGRRFSRNAKRRRLSEGTPLVAPRSDDTDRVLGRGIIISILLLFCISAFGQTKIAILRQSTGDVAVRHGTQWTPVSQTPVDLFDGDKVVSNRGRAEIFYPADGSTLTVDVGSNVTIHQTSNSSGGWLNRVKVYVGDVFFHISKTAETHNTWQLATPTAVGGVQGTEGNIHVEDEENSDFTLSEGALEVHHLSPNGVPIRDEQPVRIGAGESIQARPGVALVRAKALRAAKAPRVNVKPEELPQPKPGHLLRTRPSERPPRAMGTGPMRGAGMNQPGADGQRALPRRGATARREPPTAPNTSAKPEVQPKANTEPATKAPKANIEPKEEPKTDNTEEKKKDEAPTKRIRKVAPPHPRRM